MNYQGCSRNWLRTRRNVRRKHSLTIADFVLALAVAGTFSLLAAAFIDAM